MNDFRLIPPPMPPLPPHLIKRHFPCAKFIFLRGPTFISAKKSNYDERQINFIQFTEEPPKNERSDRPTDQEHV